MDGMGGVAVIIQNSWETILVVALASLGRYSGAKKLNIELRVVISDLLWYI